MISNFGLETMINPNEADFTGDVQDLFFPQKECPIKKYTSISTSTHNIPSTLS